MLQVLKLTAPHSQNAKDQKSNYKLFLIVDNVLYYCIVSKHNDIYNYWSLRLSCFLSPLFFVVFFFSCLNISIHVAVIENPLTVIQSVTISLSNSMASSSESIHCEMRVQCH